MGVLFIFSVVAGIVISLKIRRRLTGISCGVVLLTATALVCYFVEFKGIARFATNKVAFHYIGRNTLMLFSVSSILTWLLCWDADRKREQMK
jgi:hypothetical protein